MSANFDNTLGVLYNSVTVSAALYGAGCLQAWFYYRKYGTKDHWLIKSLVALLVILDTLQQGMLAACVYKYGVTNFGNPAILGMVIDTLIIEIYFSNFIAIIVQSFYCYRIWRLSNWIWALPSFLVSWASFVALFVYSCKAVNFGTMAELSTIGTLSKTCNILAAVADVIISVTLIIVLNNMKTGFKRSTDMINRLVIFTFSTGIPTSACAVMACISISVWPLTFWYMFFFLQMGRLYTNSFFVILNCREYIYSNTDPGTESHGYSLSVRNGNTGGGVSANADQRDRFTGTKQTEIAVRIGTFKETYVDGDEDDTKVSRQASKSTHHEV